MATLLTPPKPLVKESLAVALREKIVSGVIEPGEVIVEGKWATHFGVAQGSVREALNILASEGFVQKTHGRRARVTNFAREDIAQIYQLRGSLEGLAARLVVEQRKGFSAIEKAWDDMQQAAAAGDIKGLTDADLRFHLTLCDLPGNRFLQEHARRLLIPLFAFVLMRVHTNQRGSKPWNNSIGLHGRILAALRLGDPFLAEQFVVRATRDFALVAYDDWELKSGAGPSLP
ncbi:MAG TPA: GntR family transcriptional regulator [Terriglobia bacterium]|nr:GntR family transcriptional regulator [Terriglobia bacterium]